MMILSAHFVVMSERLMILSVSGLAVTYKCDQSIICLQVSGKLHCLLSTELEHFCSYFVSVIHYPIESNFPT